MNPLFMFILVFIVFGVILGFIFYARQKRMKEVWKGVIEDKKVILETRRSDEYNRKQEVYYLYIKLEDGTSKKLSVGKKLYDTLTVGDKIEKKAGEYDPAKV